MGFQKKKGDESMITGGEKEMHDEMVGVLTAIAIVSRRLANRLAQLDKQKHSQDGSLHEEDHSTRGVYDGIQD